MFLVNVLEQGQYEIIDRDFLHLYPHLQEQNLLALSDEQYQIYLQRHNHLTTFEQGEFVYRDIAIDVEQLKIEQQQQIWEQIKTLRHQKCRQGCYVKSADKWFHSDDASRQQYIFMRTLPDIPEKTMWKTMDGSFVAMTKSLLDELSITLFAEEQHNFITAEQHRAKMLQVENPLDYDYSQGWSKVYET